MSKGYFTNKSKNPHPEDIDSIIGSSKKNWDALTQYLTEELKLKGEFKFYGINFGWALRYKKSGKSLIALYPNNNHFTVQIILNKNQVEAAIIQLKNPIIINLIKETDAIYEGKWIYVKIDNMFDLKDIMTLIEIRIKIK